MREKLFQSLIGASGKYTIKGFSKKYNQLIQNGNFDSVSWWEVDGGVSYTVSNNIATITTTGNGACWKVITIIPNHKYLAMCELKSSYNAKMEFIDQISITQDNQWHLVYHFRSVSSNEAGVAFRINEAGTAQCRNFKVIDLTAIYGAGNEPTTIDEFLADYPIYNNYVEYTGDKGGIINAESPFYFHKGDIIKEAILYKSVDLGTLNGYVSDGKVNFYGDQLFTQPSTNDYGYKIICEKYKNDTGYNVYMKTTNKTICATSPFIGNSIIIYDTSFADKTFEEVKQALSGVILYYEPQTPVVLRGVDTIKDTWNNWNGKLTRKLDSVDLGTLTNTTKDNLGFIKQYFELGKKTYSKANALCYLYEQASDEDVQWGTSLDKIMHIGQPNAWLGVEIRDNYLYSLDISQIENYLDGVIVDYEMETYTTDTINSIHLPSGITKITDRNGFELEFDNYDPKDFSNKILTAKNSPIITAEKIITKGFTSGDEHFSQIYIYEDGEVWYVNGGSSAQAYASGVWEIEYKKIKFDSGVRLNDSERNALLNVYDL